MIDLRVVVVPAIRADAGMDPWVELVGGPGNAATDVASSFVAELRYIRQNRDVLLVDQRGTGGSNPLYCKELALHQVSSFPPRFPIDGVKACYDRLSAVADLAHYTSTDAAEDLEAVRQWLGYSQYNLFGSSYGTRVALEYMRLYPERTRSAMLWGVVPPAFRRPRFYPRDGQRALDRLFTECETTPECRIAYPRLRSEFRAVLSRLDRTPVPMTIPDPVSDDSVSTHVTHAGVAQAIWVALSYPDRAHRLPFVIHSAFLGDYEPLRVLDVAATLPRRRYYNGMHLSVVCGEEVLQNSREDLEASSAGSFMPPVRSLEYWDACRQWNIAPAGAGSTAPVRVQVPTLIISGEMDPITPPSWGELAAQTLPRSRHVVIPHLSHESSGLRGAQCLDSMFARFVAAPDPSTVSVGCIADILPPAFVLPANADKVRQP